MKALECELEALRKKLQAQVDALSERNGELELKVKFETGDLLKEIEALRDQLGSSDDVKNKLQEQCK